MMGSEVKKAISYLNAFMWTTVQIQPPTFVGGQLENESR